MPVVVRARPLKYTQTNFQMCQRVHKKERREEKIRGEQIGKNYDDIFGVLVTVNIKVTESMCALTQNIRHTYIHVCEGNRKTMPEKTRTREKID